MSRETCISLYGFLLLISFTSASFSGPARDPRFASPTVSRQWGCDRKGWHAHSHSLQTLWLGPENWQKLAEAFLDLCSSGPERKVKMYPCPFLSKFRLAGEETFLKKLVLWIVTLWIWSWYPSAVNHVHIGGSYCSPFGLICVLRAGLGVPFAGARRLLGLWLQAAGGQSRDPENVVGQTCVLRAICGGCAATVPHSQGACLGLSRF